ncbi:unnamed protein product [Ceutorhynchus assimilis]|uniref:MADF domain-containing protein n=1 Tax=Ceutorhynchus assimilis TaxID=467358 RepID=A0A9N9MMT3_9CUCU|nr:unnamed protein product [Ceutorhynchus assimilis]
MERLDHKLAELLPNYPAIWKRGCNDFKNKVKKENSFKAIAKELKTTALPTDTLNEDLSEFQFETLMELNDENSKMSIIMDTEKDEEINDIIYILEEKTDKECASGNIESTKLPQINNLEKSASKRHASEIVTSTKLPRTPLHANADKVSDMPVATPFSNTSRLSDFANYLAASLNMLDEELCDDAMAEMVVIINSYKKKQRLRNS